MKRQARLQPEIHDSQLIESHLTTQVIGRPCLLYDKVDSTNDIVKEFALQGAPEGLAIMARGQNRGRGCRGRKWLSEYGQGVYMSVLLRPNICSCDVGRLAILGGVATACALEELGLKNLKIKWPNDVLVRDRKIAGILVEPRVGNDLIEFAVLGIGVNVKQDKEAWIDLPRNSTTSCRMEGLPVDCEEVLVVLLEQLDKWYACLTGGKNEDILQAWIERGGMNKIPVIA